MTPRGHSPHLAQESRKASWRGDAPFQFRGTDRDLRHLQGSAGTRAVERGLFWPLHLVGQAHREACVSGALGGAEARLGKASCASQGGGPSAAGRASHWRTKSGE